MQALRHRGRQRRVEADPPRRQHAGRDGDDAGRGRRRCRAASPPRRARPAPASGCASPACPDAGPFRGASRRWTKSPRPPATRMLPPDSWFACQSRRLKSAASATQMIGPSQVSTVTAQGSSGRCRRHFGEAAHPPAPSPSRRSAVASNRSQAPADTGAFGLGREVAIDESAAGAPPIGIDQPLAGGARDRRQRVASPPRAARSRPCRNRRRRAKPGGRSRRDRRSDCPLRARRRRGPPCPAPRRRRGRRPPPRSPRHRPTRPSPLLRATTRRVGRSRTSASPPARPSCPDPGCRACRLYPDPGSNDGRHCPDPGSPRQSFSPGSGLASAKRERRRPAWADAVRVRVPGARGAVRPA